MGAFDVFGALSGVVGKSEALDAVGAAVAERAAKKTEGGGGTRRSMDVAVFTSRVEASFVKTG